jgi:hypothetical protein
MPMAAHALADDLALQHVESREQRRRAVPDVVVLVWTATDGIDVPE